ncbi:hypothetical protein EJC49_04760 [Aquibium carbonis]|uniref:Sulfotransferase family protein n=1 Tax=Aquibium carbonis TaxID=2495581 RepID=A0A3R9ZTR8_9HYPH|nr:sulfotransferase family 2 domain-containing protein [Aquibium carbonis]RST87539.1 hypothetical protein EJC49_04760 [Aquibium carbonis]
MSLAKDKLRAFYRQVNDGFVPVLLGPRFGRQGINVGASRHVALYPRLRLAYNRIKKNANSSTVTVLTEIESGRRLDDRPAKSASLHMQKASPLQVLKARDYHYFVIVRDPYSRVLSAFLNKFGKAEYQRRFGAFDLDRRGFRDFVAWLAKGGLDEDPHWDLQKKMLFMPLSRYDSVLTFEDYPHCFAGLLESRGIALPADVETTLAQVNLETRTRARSKMAAFYDEGIATLVRDLYEEDFDALPYDRSPPLGS